MIAIVTDSNSQLPDSLRQRYGIRVVPIIVTVDGTEYREGVDLDADGFWELWRDGQPEVSTSQPSPGDFVEAYRAAADAGADEILSIHVGSAYSGTCNSARLAAAEVDVPVRLVDTNTLSFGISCCVREAAEALARGADITEAATIAEQLSPRLGSVTILQALELTRSQGRLLDRLPDAVDGIPVLRMVGDHSDVVGTGRSVDELADMMAATMHAGGSPIRVAVCVADPSARPFAEAIERRLTDRADVVDLVHYRVGPSVGAFTGPGTAGGFWYEVQR